VRDVEKNPTGLQGMFSGCVDRTPGPCHLGSHPCRLVILVGMTRLGHTRFLLELGCRRHSDLRFGGRILLHGVVLGCSHCVLVSGHWRTS
jgi:hypothetical protein